MSMLGCWLVPNGKDRSRKVDVRVADRADAVVLLMFVGVIEQMKWVCAGEDSM